MSDPTDSLSPAATAAAPQGRSGAIFVFAGILLSRILGLVRESAFAFFIGNGGEADAWRAAFRIPNALQNLLGEGVLSASFIPVYASLMAKGEDEEAGHVAGAIGALLALLTSVLVLFGVVLAPLIVAVIATGFHGEKRELTIAVVRVLFPGAGLFVMSAWCLGILNSHRRFFLSYAAPVVWNLAMIVALVVGGRTALPARLVVIAAWGSLIGAALQLLIQLPTVLRLATHMRFVLDARRESVRTVVRNFVPVFIGRGVVQISVFVDSWLASWIHAGVGISAGMAGGAVSALGYAQILYTLPISLFGMSVSAAELPAMSTATGERDEVARQLRERLQRGLRQIAFFVVPSAAAFLALGDVIAAALFQSGRFTHDDAIWVWGTLAGSAVGLLASTLGRLYSSTYYALRDTRTPLQYAIVRVVLTGALGALFALKVPAWLGIDAKWGVAGLTASAGIAGWVEFAMLRRTLNGRIGVTGIDLGYLAKVWSAALIAAAGGYAIKLWIGTEHPKITGLAVLMPFGILYFAIAALLRVPEVHGVWSRFSRRR
ncbi:MAG: murein biosynthesis integral membrane protein MurJ [Gemmatimonadota bacterium]|nr:murein biosynthesis integral membrane protein MurJ [Gemmatimonadota bacterium]